jgi:hypothetical protein
MVYAGRGGAVIATGQTSSVTGAAFHTV